MLIKTNFDNLCNLPVLESSPAVRDEKKKTLQKCKEYQKLVKR